MTVVDGGRNSRILSIFNLQSLWKVMVQNVSGLENPISFLKRSLAVNFSQNLLLIHLSLHSSEVYWDQGKATALHQGQERQQTLTDLCASAMPQLAKKFAQHRVPCTSAAHREWMLCFWCSDIMPVSLEWESHLHTGDHVGDRSLLHFYLDGAKNWIWTSGMTRVNQSKGKTAWYQD